MLDLERQNRWREQYRLQRPTWQPATEVYADRVRQALRPESRVLDLGCGRGGLVEQLDHPLSQIVGLDPDWHSLVEHRLVLPRTAGFSDALPFANNSFDLIFCSWLLEHLATPELDFAEIGRVLRPNGLFLFITPNGRHPLAWVNRLLGRFGQIQGALVSRLYGRDEEDTFPTRYLANTVTQLESLSAKSGLYLAHWETVPDPSYLAFNPFFFRLMCWFETAVPPRSRLHFVGTIQKL